MTADYPNTMLNAHPLPVSAFRQPVGLWLLMAVNLVFVAIIFQTSIVSTLDTWIRSPEYNFGPLMPFVAAAMLWRDLARCGIPANGGYLGIVILFVGLLLGLIESLSQTHFPGQVGLFLTVIGIFMAWHGEARVRAVWPGLVFLLFGLPMANAIQVILTSALQLVSSVGAVAIIRAAEIPVLREGNVIDLGQIKLQVAEACSGLRYLFPLAAFSFLCAYLFVGHPLKKLVILLSCVPITIVMNIMRIAVTGILVDRFGSEAAQGFFHDFEGWVVYCCCLAILLAEMKVLCYIGKGDRSILRRLDLDLPPPGTGLPPSTALMQPRRARRMIQIGTLCVLTILMVAIMGGRSDAVPMRTQFHLFPRQIGGWQGSEVPGDQETLNVLNATDYLSMNFALGDQALVNVWSAYYRSQFSGNAAHSPLVCIPGGGWTIESQDTVDIQIHYGALVRTVPANRLIIAQGDKRQLVYYWFIEGGVVETNEYLAKARLFTNAVLYNRRDGALVRFITPIEGGDVEAAQTTVAKFISEIAPVLPEFLPTDR